MSKINNPHQNEDTVNYSVDPDDTKGPILCGDGIPAPRSWWDEDILDMMGATEFTQEEIYIDRLTVTRWGRSPEIEARIDMSKIPKERLEK